MFRNCALAAFARRNISESEKVREREIANYLFVLGNALDGAWGTREKGNPKRVCFSYFYGVCFYDDNVSIGIIQPSEKTTCIKRNRN